MVVNMYKHMGKVVTLKTLGFGLELAVIKPIPVLMHYTLNSVEVLLLLLLWLLLTMMRMPDLSSEQSLLLLSV